MAASSHREADARARRLGLGIAVLLLIGLDVGIRRFDLLARLAGDTLPTTLFAKFNSQVADVVHELGTQASAGWPVVLMGTSQMDLGLRPFPALRDELVRAGAPPDTHVVPLLVYATSLTDAEVLSRSLGELRGGLVVVGLGATDLGMTLERARTTPVTRLLDVGLRDGMVPPADLEARLDRWVRWAWALYRYRTLIADLLFPPEERRTPRAFFDEPHDQAEFFEMLYGPERAGSLLALREAALRGGDWSAVARYVEALQGPAYLPGLRERWRTLEPQPLQLEALRRVVANVRAAGGRPVLLLVPENPQLELDPEIGAEVRRHSDAAAALLASEASRLGIELVDLRRDRPPESFLDLNHLFYQHGGLAPRLAATLAERGLLGRDARR